MTTDDDKTQLALELAQAIDHLQEAHDLLVHGPGGEPVAEEPQRCRHCPHCRAQDHAEAGGAPAPMVGVSNDTPPASNLSTLSPAVTA